jgi:glycyl-tRNA synthetase beta subunit
MTLTKNMQWHGIEIRFIRPIKALFGLTIIFALTANISARAQQSKPSKKMDHGEIRKALLDSLASGIDQANKTIRCYADDRRP